MYPNVQGTQVNSPFIIGIVDVCTIENIRKCDIILCEIEVEKSNWKYVCIIKN